MARQTRAGSVADSMRAAGLGLLVRAAEEVIELLDAIGSGTRHPRYALRIFLRNSVLPVGCRVGRAAKPPIDLLRNMLVGQYGLVVPVQVQLARCGIVIGLSDAAAGEGLGEHVKPEDNALERVQNS